MALGADDLVFSAGTHPVTAFLERLAPAAAAGFSAMSAYPHEIHLLRAQGVSDQEIRQRVADAGMAISELDAVTTWLPGHQPPPEMPAPLAAALAGNTVERMAPMAEAVGARSLTLVELYGARPTPDTAAAAFAEVCDRAACHGVLVHLEPLPWAGIRTLAEAWDVVRRADRPNGGLLVDSWHFFRGGSTFAELEDIPGDQVLYVQLDDAPAVPEADLAEETQHRRLLPGDGALDLVGLVRTLDRIGCTAPVGAEVLSDELLAAPVDEVARRAAAATAQVLATARRP